MEVRREQDYPAEWKQVRRGWMPGSEEFRKELLGQMSVAVGPSHYGMELREIAQEIQRLKFPKIDLDELNKGDPRKIQIARRLRQERPCPCAGLLSALRRAVFHTPRN